MSDASHPYLAPGNVRAPSPIVHLLAFVWGLAESTVFFIVPDVLLTRLALRDFRSALITSLWAVAGALVGGTALWFAARHGSTQFLLNAFDWIPGISRELIVRTAQSLNAQGFTALFTGALTGQPYKLYAVHAGAQDVPLAAFLAVSAVARFARFLLTAGLVWLAGRALSQQTEAFRLRLHAYGWFAFYTTYFVVMR
jgi:membrane protein YqaA with SNARE-associated domain